ncbi:MAG TPA: hypothetical protein VGO93_14865 [Candidatus Xenobia bacterium]
MKLPRNEPGFSLPEVILAASLLSLVMVMMFNLYPTSLITIRHAEHRMTASSRAQHVLEYERGLSYKILASAAQASNGVVEPDFTASPNDLPADDLVYYKSDLTLTPTGDPSAHVNKCICNYAEEVNIKVVEWWNERGDCPNPTNYHKWHSVTVEVNVPWIKQ